MRQLLQTIKNTLNDFDTLCVNGNNIADMFMGVLNAIKNSNSVQHLQNREELIANLDREFITVATFERKRKNLMIDISNYTKKTFFIYCT